RQPSRDVPARYHRAFRAARAPDAAAVSTPKSALARVLIVILSSAALLWVASVLAVIVAGLWPNERSADAIIVLGAAQYQGRPSPVLQARLDHAIDLYHRGLAPRII